MRRIFMSMLSALILCGALTRPGAGQISISASGTAADAVRRMVPLVERFTGMRFTQIPAVRVSDADEVRALIMREQKEFYAGIAARMTLREQESIDKGLQTFVAAVLAEYSPGSGAIYLLPLHIADQLQTTHISLDEEEQIFNLIIAHELVSALHDQHYHIFTDMKGIGEVDAFHSYHAYLEGFAVFITDRIAEYLGYTEAAQRLAITGAAGLPVRAAEDRAVRAFHKQAHFHYVQGADFYRYVFEKAGDEGIRAVLAAPPRHTDIILHPARWFTPPRRMRISARKIFWGVDETASVKEWRCTEKHPGEALLRVTLAANGVEAEQMDALLDGYADGITTIWEKGAALLEVSGIAFRTRAQAIAYADAVRAALLDLNDQGVLEQGVFEDIAIAGSARAWKDTYSTSQPGNPVKEEYVAAGFVKDFLVIEAVGTGDREVAAKIEDIARKIYQNITTKR